MGTYDVTARLRVDDLATPNRMAEAKRILEVMTPRPVNWVGDLEYETRIRVEADDEAEAVRRAEHLARLRVAEEAGLTIVGFEPLQVDMGRDNDDDLTDDPQAD